MSAATTPTMAESLHQTCRDLLATGTVQVVIGYRPVSDTAVTPAFVTEPDDVGQLVFDHRCHQNLTVYLTRPQVRRLGKAAVVVKGCDEGSVVMLHKESQIDREQVHLIGMACSGTGDPIQPRCAACAVRRPRHCDVVIGDMDDASAATTGETATGETTEGKTSNFPVLDKFMTMSAEQRFEYWTAEFSRCTRCYACRQVCPLCYCQVCVLDKNRPQVVDTSAHAKGTLAFHITRAFHLGGRCAGCGACTRACPAGINLSLLNMSIAKAVEQEFGIHPGADPADDMIVGVYSTGDREDFIR
jgi:formate dehydrogenase subunit beta